jgi:hypothetical protein
LPAGEAAGVTAFEEALVAILERRAKSALASLAARDAVAATDPRAAQQLLGEVHEALLKIGEDVRCLKRLHEMAEDLEMGRESA